MFRWIAFFETRKTPPPKNITVCRWQQIFERQRAALVTKLSTQSSSLATVLPDGVISMIHPCACCARLLLLHTTDWLLSSLYKA
jgi:hypothetical protein